METTNVKKSNRGANVRRWREWCNINQDVLAEQIGVSQAALSGYEKRDKLEQEILDKIAKALDIPVEAITELEQGCMNKSTGTGTNISENIFYLSPGQNKNRDQISQSDKDRYSYRLKMSYTEPVWTNNFLDFSYNISINDTENSRKTFDFEEDTKDYTFIDPDYNKSSDTKTTNQNLTASFRSVRSKYTYNIGLRVHPIIPEAKAI